MSKSKVGSVSIQGKIGSFSHQAVCNIFQPDEIVQRDSFAGAFQDLIDGRVDLTVVPIENSTYGSIYENYDHLSRHQYRIVAETYVRVKLNLIALPGTKLSDIKKVYSHQVALDQIKNFKNKNKQIQFIPYSDTAGAVELVGKTKDITKAACASSFAAETYNLEIINKEIEDNFRNFTRFFAIGKNDSFKPDLQINKTTIQFELGPEPGSLYKTLRSFADRDLALSRIESRPIIHTDWSYRFYLDIVAGINQDKLQHALAEMRNYVKEGQVIILGSYYSDSDLCQKG